MSEVVLYSQDRATSSTRNPNHQSSHPEKRPDSAGPQAWDMPASGRTGPLLTRRARLGTVRPSSGQTGPPQDRKARFRTRKGVRRSLLGGSFPVVGLPHPVRLVFRG